VDEHFDVTNPPRRRLPRPLAWLVLLAVGAALGAGGMRWFGHGHRHGDAPGATAPSDEAPKAIYQCPMHPQITSPEPSDCPICGMKLVRVATPPQPKPGAAAGGADKPTLYQCPMHPQITADRPSDCPICGMKLVPVTPSGGDPGGSPGEVEGLATVTIDPSRQQLIGLRTAAVIQGPIGATWNTVARIQVDPTRVRKINVKVEGFVERIFIDFVGRSVRTGQPLFSLYSPTLLSAQNEFLLALQTRDGLGQAGSASPTGDSLVTAARRRLELFDVPAAEIERLERTREPSKTLTLVSPIAGVVTAKDVVQGARVGPGEAPYEITDLSVVWVMADAYEGDLRRIQVGMPATLTLAAYPGRSFAGKVVFLDPLLDPQSRTAKIHLHFANPTRELKPGLYGQVALQAKAKQGLHIPVDAVLRAGNRDVVFVALEQGKFEPRLVELGVRSGDQVEVSQGLQEGEQVVTRANFLVDSESQLRASLAALGGK
jgi:membrane fusion protein, copper/silver efflux system